MTESYASLSSRLVRLTAELEDLEADLKRADEPDPHLLQDFRRSVDEVRNTAWTIGELLNARTIRKNPQVVLSFVAAERMRRFSHMALSLAEDIDDPKVSWETGGIQKVSASLEKLQARLNALLSQHVARGRKTEN